jgi:hypothetical protein
MTTKIAKTIRLYGRRFNQVCFSSPYLIIS